MNRLAAQAIIDDPRAPVHLKSRARGSFYREEARAADTSTRDDVVDEAALARRVAALESTTRKAKARAVASVSRLRDIEHDMITSTAEDRKEARRALRAIGEECLDEESARKIERALGTNQRDGVDAQVAAFRRGR